MNKPLIITAAVLATAVAASSALSMNVFYQDLYTHYPLLDRKIVRKAYNRLMADALMQKIDVAGKTDAQMHEIFVNYYLKSVN